MKPDNLIKNETMIVIPPTLNLRGTGYHHGGHLFNRTGHVFERIKTKTKWQINQNYKLRMTDRHFANTDKIIVFKVSLEN